MEAGAPVDKTLPLFANSGHHFVFVALDRFRPDNSTPGVDRTEEIRKLCAEDKTPWSVASERTWIRYRPGRDGTEGPDQTLGFWIAVESNVGTSHRGWNYEAERPVPPREVSPESFHSATPYAYADVNQTDKKPLNLSIGIVEPGSQVFLGQLQLPPIQWIKPNSEEPIDVDLVVDFGNTRTVALLVEARDAGQRLSSICRPVRFMRRGTPYEPFEHAGAADDPCTIVDSWIVLHETLFSDLEPPAENFRPHRRLKIGDLPQGSWARLTRRPPAIGVVAETSYIPQMFVELSPSLLGGGNGLDGVRQVLRGAKLRHDKNYFLSSPKRYAWDDDLLHKESWNIELNRWNPAKDEETPHSLPRVQGPILLFMHPDGRFWDLDAGDPAPHELEIVSQRPHANDKAIHPRRDTLTWAALTVIETAHRQLCSDAYRGSHKPYSPRRLRRVVVTFPSGWTTQELESYRKQWQKAVNIFAIGHLQDPRRRDQGGDRPMLVTNLDEAVASQLPVIYSEGQNLKNLNAWLELVGRCSAPTDSKGDHTLADGRSVRIMNIDIGGGTTDVAIAEYWNKMTGSVDLNAALLFKNSNTIAGDSLVKRLIERVLLPLLATSVRDDRKADFVQFFRDPREEWLAREPTLRRKMARVVHLALVPIIHHWLREIGEGRHTDDSNRALSPEKMLDRTKQRVVDPAMVEELNELTRTFVGQEVLSDSEPLNFDPELIDECICELFSPLFRSYGKLVAAFDCDLVFVSGKPSELPRIQELLERHLPLSFDRIQLAKGYEVGSWYPVSAPSGKITDAKTITVVGAALHQAMTSGHIPGWRLSYSSPGPSLSGGNYWGLMPDPNAPGQFADNILLEPNQSETKKRLMLGSRIGRIRHRSQSLMPDQVYLLRWRRGRERAEGNLPIDAHLKRITDSGGSELLKLVQVSGVDASRTPVTLDDVELQLRTLPDDAFWMDDPRFNIHLEG